MCGICGKVSWAEPIDSALVRLMMDKMIHRGPDDEGIYIEPRVGLGHRRLAIIDLTNGRQPISNEDGTVWIVFNGEIYNFMPLREQLLEAGHKFRTQTDTEVIVHLYEEYGERCLEKLDGMFAFAIWDARKKKLFIARDRVGIKPLYYSLNRNSISFSSEIRSLLADTSIVREVDPEVIHRFLMFLYIPGPETMFKSIRKLMPGHYLTCEDGVIEIRQYWDLQFSRDPSRCNIEEATRELCGLLRRSVRSHMMSDVPIGILLSGGVDSTGLLSFCADETTQKIQTFTIGFEGEEFADERIYARLAAERYDTDHHEMTIAAAEFQEFLPVYVRHMEEPVCEAPAIALYYVTRMASKHVKVLISGEGGDEAFAGYQNYRNLVWLERMKQPGAPLAGLARLMLRGLALLNPSKFGKYGELVNIPLEDYYYSRSSGPRSPFMMLQGELYTPDFRMQFNSEQSLQYLHRCFLAVQDQNDLNKMLYVDTKTWLPDDLLIKADKMTMANSVELRVPLLDHHVLEFAASLPAHFKLKGVTTKYILKRALEGRIPQEVIKRKKTGLPVPLQSWMSGALRDYSREILMDSRTLARGYFRSNGIENLIAKSAQEKKYGKEIFSLIVLELWHREFLDA